MARYDTGDPDDLQVLIRTGLIWRAGPKTLGDVFEQFQEGTVTRVVAKEPPEVTVYLDQLGIPQDEPAPEEAVGPPAEPGDLDEEAPLG
jgi:hypothetical protein